MRRCAAPGAADRSPRRRVPAGRGGSATRRAAERDYEARQRARELNLGDHELIVTRAALDALRDGLYVLACAVEDVDRDLAGPEPPTTADLREALSWLLDAARPLCQADDRPRP